jgi:MarR family transcriptional regulator, organic hydroperoxide resistance regulator
VRRALSSSDAADLLRAEHDVQARLHALGIDVDLDFGSMAAVANVFRVASAARSHLERTVLADVGLSFTAFTVMWVLWVWGEMESRELAIDAGVTKGTLTGVVGTLERRRLVRRRRDDDDGRLVRVSATPAGERLMTGLFVRFNQGETRIVAALDAEESRQLAHLLRKVLRSMEVDHATTG